MISKALSPFGKLMVTSGGLGLLRPAPGTWGSLPPCALAFVLILAGIAPTGHGLGASIIYHAALVLVLIVFSLACVLFGDCAEITFGKKDPGSVVADETAGQCFSLMFLPLASIATPVRAAITIAMAFLAFRILDILKPWPARGLQKHRAGWGILLDDLASGIQAAVVVQVLTRLLF